MQEYRPRLVPEDLCDFEYYSKLFPIQLFSTKHSNHNTQHQHWYLYFCTSTEKEDWFLRLLHACNSVSQLKLNWPKAPSFGTMLSSTNSSCINDGMWLHLLSARLFKYDHLRRMIVDRLSRIIKQRLRRASLSHGSMFVVRLMSTI